ncbi:hypothetical protein ABPG72_009440 [Tetrahymena utriculariae]
MYNFIDYPSLPPLPQYQVDQGTVAQYYCTIPPVYNYSHYSSIEKLYLQKAENGTIFEQRTPYMNNLTTNAPRGIKTDDHMFEYFKAEEADILLQMRLLDPFSQEYKNLKKKLDYIQEIVSTFIQKKNPKMNLDLVHYGELPFMADVEQILKQEARELYFKKKIQSNEEDPSFKYFQNKLVITDPYNPQDGFYLTFEFVNWIPEDIGKIYIKYGFSKRHLQYLAYKQTKEYIPEPQPISQYNNTCFFGNQDFVKGIKPDKDELLYIEIWYANKGEMPYKWRLFGWSLHEIFDPMGVFNGGAFKIPLYDQMYDRFLINKVGLPSLTNGYFYFRLFLPEHFPSSYTIDPFSEHYFVPKMHLKNQDKSTIESALKKQQIAGERTKEILSIKKVPHSKHEGQVEEYEDILDQYSRPKTQQNLSTSENQDKLWGYSYNYYKLDKDKMIETLTKKLNKHYINSLVNPNEVSEYLNTPNKQILSTQAQTGNEFLKKTLDDQIKELLPSSYFQVKDGKVENLTSDGIQFKITKLLNVSQNLESVINIKGALVMDNMIIQDASNQPCVVAVQSRVNQQDKNNYQVDFAHTFQTRNNNLLAQFSYHNFQNAIVLITLFNENGSILGWMHASLLKLQRRNILLNTGKFRVRLCKVPVLQPPLNYNLIKYSDIAIEYQLMEGNLAEIQKRVEEENTQLDPELEKKESELRPQSSIIKSNQKENDMPQENAQNVQVQQQQQQQQEIVKGENPNESSIKDNNVQSTMINPNSSLVNESQNNKTGIVDQILNKSIIDNPRPLKAISLFMDGLVNVQDKYPTTFKMSLLKDSLIYADDNKAKISFQCNKFKIPNDEREIQFLEEVMVDLDMQKFFEKNKKLVDKYHVIVQILDSRLNLLLWHYSPLFIDGNLNIQDFQVKLYKPPFQVPTRVNHSKLVESEVICKYGIGYTDNLQI